MKKIYLLIAVTMMSTALFAQLQVATFDEEALNPQYEESAIANPTDGTFYLKSGSFTLTQTVAYTGSYVTGAVVSNVTSTNYDGTDYSLSNTCKSAKGGAFSGKNYVVWYWDSYATTPDYISLEEAAVIPGMYVCNTAWVVKAVTEGDGMSTIPGGFTLSDYFTLTITGSRSDDDDGEKTVTVDLAKGVDFIDEWTYVDLSPLGAVDKLTFKMAGSKQNTYGLTTPTYFCIDDLGATKPEGIRNTNAASKAVKVVRDGQVVIIRDDKAFNILGAEL